jgi:hypothetical protein
MVKNSVVIFEDAGNHTNLAQYMCLDSVLVMTPSLSSWFQFY